jgi:hypothetical protein
MWYAGPLVHQATQSSEVYHDRGTVQVKTRMMAAEGKKSMPLSQAFSDLYAAQGIKGFYRGLEANIMRAMVLNGRHIGRQNSFVLYLCHRSASFSPNETGTKMACYDQIKIEVNKLDIVPKGLVSSRPLMRTIRRPSPLI